MLPAEKQEDRINQNKAISKTMKEEDFT